MTLRIAFIGFGVVAQGLSEILLEKKQMLKERFGFDWSVVAISDIKKGAVYDKDGLNMGKILDLIKKGKKVDEYPTGIKGMDSMQTIKETDADVIVEVTFTDVKTGQPAIDHIRAAFESGKHVVSTNKGPVVKMVNELQKVAEEKNLHYRFEGVVLAGTPVINLVKYCLAGNEITAFQGILNGTTNYILTRMEEGMAYEDALKKAQELGYAEADPTGDVEGFDALGKVVILTNVVLGKHIGWQDVKRTGITNITKEDIKAAKAEGKRYKLIGKATIDNDGSVDASVKPVKIPLSDPLAGINEAINALTFTTDELGPVTIIGPGAGKRETGFSLLVDLLNLTRNFKKT